MISGTPNDIIADLQHLVSEKRAHVVVVGQTILDEFKSESISVNLGGAWTVAAGLSAIADVTLITDMLPRAFGVGEIGSFVAHAQSVGHPQCKRRILAANGNLLAYEIDPPVVTEGRAPAFTATLASIPHFDVLVSVDYGAWLDGVSASDELTARALLHVCNVQINRHRPTFDQARFPRTSTVLAVNEAEGAAIRKQLRIPVLIPDAIAPLHQTNAVVETFAERGAVWRTNGAETLEPGFPVASDRWAIGMGDSFLGYLGLCLANGYRPSKALRIACLAGAAKAGVRGNERSIAPSDLFSIAARFR